MQSLHAAAPHSADILASTIGTIIVLDCRNPGPELGSGPMHVLLFVLGMHSQASAVCARLAGQHACAWTEESPPSANGCQRTQRTTY
jgi:hypothetical protein